MTRPRPAAHPGTYRAPMRSRNPAIDPDLAVERALARGLCGIGGRLQWPPASAESAVRLTAEVYDELTARRLERFVAVPSGAVVWTRDAAGFFHRGSITGAWRYDDHRDAVAADLVHVRACDWEAPGLAPAAVPAPVAASFARGGLNFQRIRAAGP